MPDNVNITVNETIENVVVNPSVTTEVIDVNISSTTEEINIDITPNLTTININTIPGGFYVPYTGATQDVNLGEFDITAAHLIKDGGQASQFLKADGSVDNNVYLTSADLPSTLDLYATTTASDVSGYTVLVRNISDSRFNTTAVDVSTGVITTTAQLVGSLVSDANIISGNPGIFNITTIGNISRTNGTGQAEFFFRVYKRTSAGVETFITESSKTLPVTNGGYSEFSATALWNDGVFLDTDRVVLKYYADRLTTPTGSNPTYKFQFGGISPVRSTAAIPVAVLPNIYLRDLADVENVDALNNEVLYWNDADSLWEHSSVIDLLSPASSTVNGYLSSTDWTAFNGKFNLPTLTSGSVLFSDGTTIAQKNSNFFWNNTNNRLGIGTNAPNSILHLSGSITAVSAIARGGNITPTLVAAANSDVLIGLKVFPTFTNGAFTGVSNYSISADRSINVVGTLSYKSGYYFSYNGDQSNAIKASIEVDYNTGEIKYFAANPYFPTFYAGASERLRITAAGNTLINTTTDNGGKLQIKAPGALSTDIALRVRNSADNLDLMSVNGDGIVSINRNSSSSSNSLSIINTSTTGSNFIKIGQNSDNSSLGFGWYPSSSGTYRDLIANTAYMYALSGASQMAFNTTTSSQPIIFCTNDWNERMRVNGIGNVLIGTKIDQGGKLQIKAPGALSTDIALRVRNSADTGDLMTVAGNGNFVIPGVFGVTINGGQNNAISLWGARVVFGVTSSISNRAFISSDNGITLTAGISSGVFINNGNLSIGGSTIHASAQLDVISTTKGFLPPRMTNAQRIAIATPAVGLCVYCTDVVEGLYINKSTGWTFIG
jgi:hypothetical protein